ncbi:MAG: SprB repeat-containing protein, partial [Saprospiraceae bacterium]|nr:SprB repeat-containing protein [Saprospiraceae bacterium]
MYNSTKIVCPTIKNLNCHLHKVITCICSLLCLCLGIIPSAQAQVLVTTNQTATDIASTLVGSGVTISNAFFGPTCDVRQFSTFTNSAGNNVPFTSGVFMCTGFTDDHDNVISNVDPGFSSAGPGAPGDSDLDALIPPFTTNDAAILEFDFVAESNNVFFNYVFASEEYNEFTCSDFNDVFAFIVSGPGLPAQNIALVPGTALPVTINNVNNGTVGASGNIANCTGTNGSLAFSAFFQDNPLGSPSIEFDGLTVALTAEVAVQPCSTYHIKLAVADAFDNAFDSGVFLEAGSFSSDVLNIQTVTANSDSVVTEDCNTAQITLSLPTATTTAYNIPHNIFGTAINGTDYNEIFPSDFTIPAGASSVTIDIIPIADAITEGLENLFIEIQVSPCQFDTIELFINEETLLDTPVVTCNTLSASAISYTWGTVLGATGYEVSEDNGATWIPANPGPLQHDITGLSPNSSATLLVRAIGGFQACSENPSDTSTCTTCVLPVSINIDANVSCNGGADGIATAIPGGGNPPYTYLWSNGQTTQTATGLSAGVVYTVTVSDPVCSTPETVILTEPTALILNLTPTDLSCNGINDGTVTAAPTGGTAPYSYLWDNGATTATITGLAPNTYCVTITDDNGCTITDCGVVGEPTALTLTTDSTDASCNGGADGTATATVAGGTAGYTYLWDDPTGQNTATANNLTAGTYCVTVTDNNGCTITDCTIVNEPIALALTIAVTSDYNGEDISCNGTCDGEATVTVVGGTAPYTYLWDNATAQTTAIATGLCTGTSNVTVTDDNGCTATISITLTEPIALNPSIVGSTDASCGGTCDGTADVNVIGGIAPYTYLWDNGQTTTNSTGLCAGNQCVTVTDANGCTATICATINEPTPVTVSIAITVDYNGENISCNGASDGELTATAAGGTAGYTYLWDDPAAQTTAIASN